LEFLARAIILEIRNTRDSNMEERSQIVPIFR
jgi:hypothetical protein